MISRSRETFSKKIAIVGDALVVPGGAEKVTLCLSDIFSEAPIYTSAYLPENTFPEFKGRKIITMPFASHIRSERQFKRLFPWWYLTFSTMDLRGFDVILSSSSYLAKYINPPRGAVHICCLQNPFRLLWKTSQYTRQSSPYNRAAMTVIKWVLPMIRKIDVARTRRIHHVIANSRNMARQMQTIYGIEPEVIYPPIDCSRFSIAEAPQDFYLHAGRLISHKHAELAVEACNRLKRRLVVAGDGPERTSLEKLAGETVTFTGRLPDGELRRLYSHCRALLFPSDEDFGMVPVEVQASGRPVIAYRSGGALETVIENKTGLFFDQQEVESLCKAILDFEKLTFDPVTIRENARRFDQAHFERQIRTCVERFG